MGGPGSGKWCRWNKKATVEDSFALPVYAKRKWLVPYTGGTMTWSRPSIGKRWSVKYFITPDGDALTVTLHYCWRYYEEVRLPVPLQTTPTHFGGRRWWFNCPLCVNGVPCNRRVGKLYLPAGARYFGCRTCYLLTYESCQQAHQLERLLGPLAVELGYSVELGRELAADWSRRR